MLPIYKHQPNDRYLTKEQERERMADLAREREARTPERLPASWIARAWRRLIS